MKAFTTPKLATVVLFSLDNTDRDPADPTHWMPVPFPGLSLAQLEALTCEADRRPYTPRVWLQLRQRAPASDTLPTKPDFDRDPRNPLHWMPVPPPVISPEQIKAKAEAFGLN
jgi:hypothetical protein